MALCINKYNNITSKNCFKVLLCSQQATYANYDAATWTFNVGSVLGAAPNAIDFSQFAYSTIALKNFSINRTTAEFTADEVDMIFFKVVGNYPNNFETQDIAAGKPNLASSQTIGTIQTGNTDSTFLPSSVNSAVIVGNFFQGDITIILYSATLEGPVPNMAAAQPWVAELEIIYYEKEDSRNLLLEKELVLGSF